jgi:hypothetical protein
MLSRRRRKIYEDYTTVINVSRKLILYSGPLRFLVGPVACISRSPPWGILNRGQWNSEKCIETWIWQFLWWVVTLQKQIRRLSLKMSCMLMCRARRVCTCIAQEALPPCTATPALSQNGWQRRTGSLSSASWEKFTQCISEIRDPPEMAASVDWIPAAVFSAF